MVARFIGFLLLMLFGATVMVAQEPYTGRVVDEKGAPIQDVNVMLYRSETIAMGFGFTDADGRFSIHPKTDVRPVAIGFVLLGYEARRIDIEEFRNGAEVVLKSVVFELREVSVRPDRIRRQNDTLVYNVSSFKLSQDRSIADVIRKMPGLEVSKNGTISFQGTPINKFYIEGMDLMGSKYAQASENINADMIGSVQVLQNHQPINSLKGLRFSDQAALNITLKENVKNVWSGIVDVGAGTALQDRANLLYSSRIMAMVFGRRRQNLSMYKGDSTGKDISREVMDLAALTRDAQKEDGLLSRLVAPAPDLEAERSAFNHSHMAAINHLVRTKRENDVRLQIDYLWDRQRGNSGASTAYLDLGGAILSEESSVVSKLSRLNGELTYKVNKDKIYINNRLSGSMAIDKSEGTSTLDAVPTTQDVRIRKFYITEDFQFVAPLRKENSIEGGSQSTYSYLPGQILAVGGFVEKLNISALESNNHVAFNHKVKGLTLSQRVGYKLRKQEIAVRYPEVEATEGYLQQNLYVSSGINMERWGHKLNAAVKVDLMHRRYATQQGWRLSLQPSVRWQYDWSGLLTSQFSYSYAERPQTLMALYRTPIFTSYRVATAHSGALENRGSHMISMSWKYQNPIAGRFYTLMGNWTRRTNEVLYKSALDGVVYRRTPTDIRYNPDSYWVRGEIARSFYWAHTLVSLKGMQVWSDYYLLQQGVLTSWQARNTNVTLSISMQPAKIFSYELSSQMQINKQINRENPKLSHPQFASFEHSIDLYLFPIERLEVGLKGELYHYSDKNLPSNFFADIYLSYKMKRWELRLKCSNLLGNNLYEHRVRTSTTDIYSSYRLRPRELFLTTSFQL